MRFAINLVIPVLVMIFLIHQPWICEAANFNREVEPEKDEVEDLLQQASKISLELPNIDWFAKTADKVDIEWYQKSNDSLEFIRPSQGPALKIVPSILEYFYKNEIQISGTNDVNSDSSKTNQFVETFSDAFSKTDQWLDEKITSQELYQYASLRGASSILNNLNEFYKEYFNCIFGNECENDKNRLFEESTSPNSTFRSDLNILISRYLLGTKTLYASKKQQSVFQNLLDEMNSKKDERLKCRDREWKELMLLRLLETYITNVIGKTYAMIVGAQMVKYIEQFDKNPTEAYSSLTTAIKMAQNFYELIPKLYVNVENSMSNTFNNIQKCPPKNSENGLVLTAIDFVQENWEHDFAPSFYNLRDKYSNAVRLLKNSVNKNNP